MNKTLTIDTYTGIETQLARMLGALTGLARRRLLDLAVVIHYEAQDNIFREGERADFFYCVLSGYVRLYHPDKSGRQADIRLCGPGDSFAECLLYSGDNHRYDAEVAETAMLARFDMEDVRLLARTYPEIDRALLKSISDRLLDSMDLLAKDRLYTAPQRVANYLLTACGEECESASLRLPFRKSLLAGKLGLAPEALSRAFSFLRQAGVSVRGRTIEIGNMEALRRL